MISTHTFYQVQAIPKVHKPSSTLLTDPKLTSWNFMLEQNNNISFISNVYTA